MALLAAQVLKKITHLVSVVVCHAHFLALHLSVGTDDESRRDGCDAKELGQGSSGEVDGESELLVVDELNNLRSLIFLAVL